VERNASAGVMNDAVVINNPTGLRQHRLLPSPLPRPTTHFPVTADTYNTSKLNLWLLKVG
jgi:hypothetical protein